MSLQIVSGVPELQKRMKDVGEAGARRASMKALRKAGALVARKARLKAPVGRNTKRRQKLMGGKFGVRLKPSVKVRSIKTVKKSVVGIKVSVGAKHGHFVVLGVDHRKSGRPGKKQPNKKRIDLGASSDRERLGGFLKNVGWLKDRADLQAKKGNKGTGQQKPNPFFRKSVAATKPEAKKVMIETLAYEIEKEWIQSKKK